MTTFNAAGQPVPGVAESWEISEDGRIYTFHLRPDARWSDGRTVTAHDFVRSWNRTLAPETASEYAYQLYYVKNGKAFNEGSLKDFSEVGVVALNDRTLRVTLENPTPFFLDLCAFVTLMPVPVDVIENHGDDWVKPEHIIGNGAYILKEWRVNHHVLLEKNPHYWNRDNVAMESVEFLPISNANTAFNFYWSGRADLLLDKSMAPPSLLGDLKNRPDFHAAPFLGTYFLRFNATTAPFDDPRVRKAFSLVIDKKYLVEKITRAGEVPASALVPPDTAGYQSPPGLQMDRNEARRLMKEAGYEGGKGFPLVTYLFSEGELDQPLAVELQNMWKRELGVNVDLRRQEWKTYLGSLSGIRYDIARSSWVGDYADPNTFLDMFVTGGGNNRTGWSSAQYDSLIQQAAEELDKEKRFDIFREAEMLLLSEETVICPLYFYVGIQMYHPDRLGGIEANLLDEHPVKAMYWKDR